MKKCLMRFYVFFTLMFCLACIEKKQKTLKTKIVEDKKIKIDSVKIKEQDSQSQIKKVINNSKLELNDFLKQRLFLIEKETDSSYQVGSFQIKSLLSRGSIYGWIKITNKNYTYLYANNAEYMKEIYNVKRIVGNVVSTEEDGSEGLDYNIQKANKFDNNILLIKDDSYETNSYHVVRESDIDSTYIFNSYKEKERQELIEEFGEEYEKFLVDEGIESYQHSPDYIYMKYVLKDFYKHGTFVENGCELITNLSFLCDSNVLKTSKKGKHVFIYNSSQNYKERVKRIYKDKDEYVVMSDMLPKGETYGNHSNFILKDRIIRIRKENDVWKAKESFGTEIIYKSLPMFYVNDKAGLNVRNKPSVKGDKITKLEYNEKVYVIDTLQNQVIGKLHGQWLEIKLAVSKGYIFSPYISKLPNSKSPDE